MQAYVLVQSQLRANGIARELMAVPGVVRAEDLRGPYDAIALVHSDSSARPLEGVIAEIREVPDVTRALSAPLLHPATELGDDEAA